MSAYGSFGAEEEERKRTQAGQQQTQLLKSTSAYKAPSSRLTINFVSVRVMTISGIILVFLGWVACCVAFGGGLQNANFHTSMMEPIRVTFYWNRWKGSAGVVYYSDSKIMQNDDFQGWCLSGGRGFLALSAFAFIFLTFSLVLAIFRLIDQWHLIPILGKIKEKYIRGEMVLGFACCLLIFFMTITWGSTCFERVRSSNVFVDAIATGYAFICSCEFFLITNLLILYAVRNKELNTFDDSFIPPSSGTDSLSNSFPSALADERNEI